MPSKKNSDLPKELQKRVVEKPMSISLFDVADGSYYAAILAASLTRASDHMEKLAMLMEHYGIDESGEAKYLLLSLALAKEYIPGFQTAKPKGRGKKWGFDNRLLLIGRICNKVKELNVQEIIRVTKSGNKKDDMNSEMYSISRACELLSKAKVYDIDQESVKRRYAEAWEYFVKSDNIYLRILRKTCQENKKDYQIVLKTIAMGSAEEEDSRD